MYVPVPVSVSYVLRGTRYGDRLSIMSMFGYDYNYDDNDDDDDDDDVVVVVYFLLYWVQCACICEAFIPFVFLRYNYIVFHDYSIYAIIVRVRLRTFYVAERAYFL